MLYAVLVAALVALDQLVKYLVVQQIPLGEHVPFLPHLLDLTYVENTGAAFSMFSQHTWVLTLISLVLSVVLAVGVFKPLFRHPFGRTALALLLAGAVGNLIDRAGPAAGGGGGQPHRPGPPGLCGGHVPRAVHGVRRLQCGRHLRGSGGLRRGDLLPVLL